MIPTTYHIRQARLDLAYEEQLGGVDSELTKRRHEYDSFVQAEKDWEEVMRLLRHYE